MADYNEHMCPWCLAGDFDLVGLKDHLTGGHCEEFEATVTVEQWNEARKRQNAAQMEVTVDA